MPSLMIRDRLHPAVGQVQHETGDREVESVFLTYPQMTPIQITAIVNAILELRKKDVTMQKASDLCHEAFYED